MTIDAQTIDAATKGIRRVSENGTFKTLIALVAIGGCVLLVWRDEVRADAQIHVLEAMKDEIKDLRRDFRAAGVRAAPRAAVEATDRE